MKRARAPLDVASLETPGILLTTSDVARLLRVHPKHVYRLLRRGLPGRRVGGEWRFLSDEVIRWAGATTPERMPRDAEPARASEGPASLIAANGDVAIELLLGTLTDEGRPLLGLVRADRNDALELLRRKEVLIAGCHGTEIPLAIDGERLAFIHLVDREIGLAVRRGLRIRSVREIRRRRLASRPPTAGVRAHLDRELAHQGLDPIAVHGSAILMKSHQEVVCAVARGDADVGVTTVAWAERVGLEALSLCQDTYGLLVRASLLGDPRVVALCEVVQSAAYRRHLRAVNGYDASRTGKISYARVRTRAAVREAPAET